MEPGKTGAWLPHGCLDNFMLDLDLAREQPARAGGQNVAQSGVSPSQHAEWTNGTLGIRSIPTIAARESGRQRPRRVDEQPRMWSCVYRPLRGLAWFRRQDSPGSVPSRTAGRTPPGAKLCGPHPRAEDNDSQTQNVQTLKREHGSRTPRSRPEDSLGLDGQAVSGGAAFG